MGIPATRPAELQHPRSFVSFSFLTIALLCAHRNHHGFFSALCAAFDFFHSSIFFFLSIRVASNFPCSILLLGAEICPTDDYTNTYVQLPRSYWVRRIFYKSTLRKSLAPRIDFSMFSKAFESYKDWHKNKIPITNSSYLEAAVYKCVRFNIFQLFHAQNCPC